MHKLKYDIQVPPFKQRVASDFYVKTFGARFIKTHTSFPMKDKVTEIELHGTRILITSRAMDKTKASSNPIIELVTGSEFAKNIPTTLHLMQLSQQDELRGITWKFRDPYDVIWLIREVKYAKPEIPQKSFCHMCCLPTHMPALCSEMRTWNQYHVAAFVFPPGMRQGVLDVAHRQGGSLATEMAGAAIRAAESAFQTVSRLQADSHEIRNMRRVYEQSDCYAFSTHPSLSLILTELEEMNGYLQATAIALFFNPSMYLCNGVGTLTNSVDVDFYQPLLSAIPPVPHRPWPHPRELRKCAADELRQLLKALQQARTTMHNIHASILSDRGDIVPPRVIPPEEREMKNLLYNVVLDWRKQDSTEMPSDWNE